MLAFNSKQVVRKVLIPCRKISRIVVRLYSMAWDRWWDMLEGFHKRVDKVRVELEALLEASLEAVEELGFV